MKRELFNPKRFIRLFSQTLASGLAIFFLNQFFGIAIDDMQAVMFILLVICILLIAYLAHKSSRITGKWRTRLETSEQEFRAAKAQLRSLEERAEEFEKSSNESRKADA
ncbi:hypothetical protein LPB19_03560 [Marinobacter salinisoli]|uniref:Uncharacterized protein n=1 Tax=Marinobacter salinisoli TaxID=2769486 RepID=A0ABX7MVI6_9GAMM|nr:hypothetical protein [Marinobacter salinisoli]QSP95507.1 hypothetical protein LPB19_03560 [Marinobacter salinisoli]